MKSVNSYPFPFRHNIASLPGRLQRQLFGELEENHSRQHNRESHKQLTIRRATNPQPVMLPQPVVVSQLLNDLSALSNDLQKLTKLTRTPAATSAQVLEIMDIHEVISIIKSSVVVNTGGDNSKHFEKLAEIFNHMRPTKAAAILGSIDHTIAAHILSANNMDHIQAAVVLNKIESQKVARIFAASQQNQQGKTILIFDSFRVAVIVNSMDPNKVHDIFKVMPQNIVDEVLKSVDIRQAKLVKRLQQQE